MTWSRKLVWPLFEMVRQASLAELPQATHVTVTTRRDEPPAGFLQQRPRGVGDDRTAAEAARHTSDQDDLMAGVHRLHPPRESGRVDWIDGDGRGLATVVDDPTGNLRRPRPRSSASAGHVVQGTRPSVPSAGSPGCTSSWRQASLWHFSPKIAMDSYAQLMVLMPLPLPLSLLLLLLLLLVPLYSHTDCSMRILY